MESKIRRPRILSRYSLWLRLRRINQVTSPRPQKNTQQTLQQKTVHCCAPSRPPVWHGPCSSNKARTSRSGSSRRRSYDLARRTLQHPKECSCVTRKDQNM
eukprot:g17855.t1